MSLALIGATSHANPVITNSKAILEARPVVFLDFAKLEKYVLASKKSWDEFLNKTVLEISKKIAQNIGACAVIPYSSDMNKFSWTNLYIVDPIYDITTDVIDVLNKKYF